MISQIKNRNDVFYKESTLALVRLKTINRETQLVLDSQRKDLDTKKAVIEKLQQQLETLRYKEANLSREIRECKNIKTPNLSLLEKEVEASIGTMVYSSQLEDITAKTITFLEKEKETRIQTQTTLDELENMSEKNNEILDKKRRFLDELPSKLQGVNKSSEELQSIFEEMLKN